MYKGEVCIMGQLLTRADLMRRLVVPKAEPAISDKRLQDHADRFLQPSIQTVGLRLAEQSTKLVVKGLFEEDVGNMREMSSESVPPRFRGKTGEVLELYNDPSPGQHTILIGLGKREKFDEEGARNFGALAVRSAENAKFDVVTIDLPSGSGVTLKEPALVEAITLGAMLSSYRYDQRLGVSEEDRPVAVKELYLLVEEDNEVNRFQLKKALTLAGCQNTARYLSDMSPDELNPATYPLLLELFAHRFGLQFLRLMPEELVAMGLEGIANVGRASPNPGSLILLGQMDSETDPLHVMVGKGITFDSSGMSVKSAEGMFDMHMDMEGSAAVVNAIRAILQLGWQSNILALACIAENRISENAYLLNSAIQIGRRRVLIKNTDAEGRLVLGDGLALGAHLRPDNMVTIATLTGAAIIALSKGMGAAAFTADDRLKANLVQAAQATGERVHFFDTFMDPAILEAIKGGDLADLANISNLGKEAGHITAARFLRELAFYVGDDGKEVHVPFAHVDMAPMMDGSGALKKDPRFRGDGFALGYGANLLARFYRDLKTK